MSARCSFHVLNREDPESSPALYPRTPSGSLVLEHPPAPGDLIYLRGDVADPADPDGNRLVDATGTYRVVARDWMPASYGSPAWRAGEQAPGPITLELMVEPATGLFDPAHYRTAQPAGGAR